MNVASEDIKDMLEAESSLGLTFGTDLFIGKEPNAPDNCVTIFDTPGGPTLLELEGAALYYYPSVQIRVRNNNYKTGWNTLNNIKTTLDGIHSETWNGTVYTVIHCILEPAFLDWDDNDRPRFVSTFDIQRR